MYAYHFVPLPGPQAATLGSQEGAFESVRLNFSGDQGHTMRQLISGNSIRRVAVCALSSIKEKRQHLAVNHDKGKVCVCVCVCVSQWCSG